MYIYVCVCTCSCVRIDMYTLHTLYNSDVQKIHDGIGDKVALLLQWLATFVGGFVIGFVRDWRLTLLLMVFAPFLALGGFVMSKVSYYNTLIRYFTRSTP